MSMSFRLRTLLASVALVGLATLPLFAATGKSELLDRDGNFYRLRATTYGLAAPDGSLTAADTPVLVLDVTSVDGLTSQIVPRSLGWEWDQEGQIFLDPSSGSLCVLWVLKGWGSDEVRLSIFRQGVFTSEHRLSGSQMGGRKNLDAVIGLQFISSGLSGGTASTAFLFRQVLQVVWWESFPWGGGGPRYVPVFLKNDGSIETENALVYDPTEGFFDGSPCDGPIPEAAYYPAVIRESFAFGRLAMFSPSICRFLVIPISFVTQHGSENEDGEPAGQARHIPFIGVTLSLEKNDDITAAVGATPSRFDTGGTFDTGYQAALSWTENGTFNYQFYQSSALPGSRWGEIRQIPLDASMTSEKARTLVRSLIESR